MAIFNPFRAASDKYRAAMKNNQRTGSRIATGLIFAGVIGMLAISVATGGATTLGLLGWAGVGTAIGSLMGGLQMKYTLSKFFIAEQEQARREKKPGILQPVADGLGAGKKAALSLVRAARPQFGRKMPPAANNNTTPAVPKKNGTSGPKG